MLNWLRWLYSSFVMPIMRQIKILDFIKPIKLWLQSIRPEIKWFDKKTVQNKWNDWSFMSVGTSVLKLSNQKSMVRSLYLSPYLCPSIWFAMELIAWSLSNLRRDNHIMKRIIFSIEFQMSLQPRQQQQQIFPKSLTYAIYPWHGNSSAIIHQIQLKIFYKHIQLINRRRHRRNTYDVCVCARI